MSDQQQGPGWWLASDGKWYPPEQAPPVPPLHEWAAAPAGPPPRKGMPTGAIVALVVGGIVGVLVLLGVAAAVVGEDSDSSSSRTDDTVEGDDPDPSGGDGEPAAVPDGFERLEGNGVAIAAPTGWTVLDADDVAMTPEEFAVAFPDAPPAMAEQGSALVGQGAVLVAFDFTDDAFASNVNVIEVPGEARLGVVRAQAEQQLEDLGGELVESGNVQLGTGEAVRIEYTLDVALPDGSSTPAGGVQYYMPIDGRTYIVTISSATSAADLADRMIETFTVS